MDTFTRGATVSISVQFRDADGNVTNPGSASAVLRYRNTSRVWSTETVTLTQSGNNWIGTWDSSVAAEGVVYGHATTPSASPPVSADDFSFTLHANRANIAS